MGDAARPLASWRFAGEFRRSQLTIFEAVGAVPGNTPEHQLHIVAPPGSGKTLVGLELARQDGARALALAPTTTIRSQWARSARQLAAGTWGSGDDGSRPASAAAVPPVSEDPASLGDFTALTYQMLSVLETSSPFDELARVEWIDELVEAGRSSAAADAWLTELAATNRAAYQRGVRRRAGRLRKDVVRADPAALEAALHPNARALITRIADHGVTTLILDECHHLLDHWAVVVHCLAGRIRERGVEPRIIGLTATLPSEDDRTLYENYTGLLGDVDYELPTPAVVKEGNLAPYRDFAWFVTPTPDELSFLRTQDRELEQLVSETLAGADGLDFLEHTLVGGGAGAGSGAGAGAAAEAGSSLSSLTARELESRLAAAFKADFTIAEAAIRVLAELDPHHEIVRAGGPAATPRPSTEQRLRVLARYALERILPDPERAALWAKTRGVLADFGYHLTDRGVRRGRDPIDQVLATSAAKDSAIGEILRLELGTDTGSDMRAVVLVDFAVHGHGTASRGDRAGALRCFDTVVADPRLTELRPVMVTGQHMRIAARDTAALLPRLAAILGRELATSETSNPAVVELETAGIGSAAVVAAVSQLVAEGSVRLLVGTRGLLGEGWDCPAVNTLIDLSVAATSAATQQLRGRTLRLDPAWPEKVAHNWTVACVLEADTKLDGTSDVARLTRKHAQVWGIALDETAAVVRGLEHTLTSRQLVQLDALSAKRVPATRAADLNRATVEALPRRSDTRLQWRIGEDYLGEERAALAVSAPPKRRPFASSVTLQFVLLVLGTLLVLALLQLERFGSRLREMPVGGAVVTVLFALAVTLWGARDLLGELWRSVRQRALPATAYQGAAFAIARVLHTRDFVRAFGRGNIVVVPQHATPRVVSHYTVEVRGGSLAEQRLLLDTLEELMAPVRSPRFLLEIGVSPLSLRNPVSWLAGRITSLLGVRTRYLQVPAVLGRRRADAQLFAREWTRQVGPCTLHEIDSPEELALLTRARKRSAAPDTRTTRREVWA